MGFLERVGVVVLVTGCGSVAGTPDGAVGGDTPGGVTHTLIVTKTGTGAGTVTSSVGGIACGATCSGAIAEGTAVTLTAAADPGSVFVKWTGGCTGSGTCAVTVSADTSVIAQFSPGAVLDFPIAGDQRVTVNGTDFSSDGDYVNGTRATSGLTQATYAKVHLVLDHNTLTGAACAGTQKTQDVVIHHPNKRATTTATLGTIPIASGQTVVDAEYTFAAIQGPTFDIEYITNASVSPGCGGSSYSNTGSTLTLVNQ